MFKIRHKVGKGCYSTAPLPLMGSEAVHLQVTGESSPPEYVQSPTMADGVLVVQWQKKPAKRHCKGLRFANPLRRTRKSSRHNRWHTEPVFQ